MADDSLPQNQSLHPPLVTREVAIACNLKRYFTGQPCRHGHICERLTASRQCLGCARLRRRRYVQKNRLKMQEAGRRDYQDHRDKRIEAHRKWYAKNLAKTKADQKRWRLLNPDKMRSYLRHWRIKNPLKAKMHRAHAEARRRTAEGVFSAKDIERIMKQQKDRCANTNCRKSLKGCQIHVDHITPVAKGGTNWPRNLQLLCAACNLSKSARDPLDHARLNGLLL